ncbi:MAG: hypothetical protein ACRDTD_15055 [Pseudonocardiaceae bacterium]
MGAEELVESVLIIREAPALHDALADGVQPHQVVAAHVDPHAASQADGADRDEGRQGTLVDAHRTWLDPPFVQRCHPLEHGLEVLLLAPVRAGDRVCRRARARRCPG